MKALAQEMIAEKYQPSKWTQVFTDESSEEAVRKRGEECSSDTQMAKQIIVLPHWEKNPPISELKSCTAPMREDFPGINQPATKPFLHRLQISVPGSPKQQK